MPAPRLILEPASLHGSMRGSLRGSLRGSRPASARSVRRHQDHQARQPVQVLPLDAAALQHHQALFVEDVDGGEYRVLDPSRILVARRADQPPQPHQPHQHHLDVSPGRASQPHHEDLDTDSLRRHERERGSDQADDEEYRYGTTPRARNVFHRERGVLTDELGSSRAPRQHLFLREGGAEILRLVSQGGHPGGGMDGGSDDPLLQSQHLQPGELRPYTHVEETDQHLLQQQQLQQHLQLHHQQLQQQQQLQQHGKDIIMRRFMEDQGQQVSEGLNSSHHDLLLGQVRTL